MLRSLLIGMLFVAGAASAQQVPLGSGSVVRIISTLKPGQFVWAPQVAPAGPMLLVVNISTQKALLFRNGLPIAASTVSTGKTGHATPTGVFTILQKEVEHYSSKYDDAPMPYMERLTWQGIALHAGHLPGYPASHGCIRLPAGFAKLLYAQTSLGMTVVITKGQPTPRIAQAPDIVAATTAGSVAPQPFDWHPEKSPGGPVSIVVSIADQRAIVLRNGVEIGTAPVKVEGPANATWAYELRDVDASGQHWMRLPLTSDHATGDPVPRQEWQRFHAPDGFKQKVAEIVRPGTTIVVTSDSLVSGAAVPSLTVMDAETPRKD
jgi:hypothetical protein